VRKKIDAHMVTVTRQRCVEYIKGVPHELLMRARVGTAIARPAKICAALARSSVYSCLSA
jgi:hypothetical protein